MGPTDGMGTLVHEVGPVRVTRHHTMGQTWYHVLNSETLGSEGWYSEEEACRAAGRLAREAA